MRSRYEKENNEKNKSTNRNEKLLYMILYIEQTKNNNNFSVADFSGEKCVNLNIKSSINYAWHCRFLSESEESQTIF